MLLFVLLLSHFIHKKIITFYMHSILLLLLTSYFSNKKTNKHHNISLLLPNCGISLDFKVMSPLFSEYLQFVDFSGNNLKGCITDAFSVDLKQLVSFNVSGNKKLMGDACEHLGKSPKLTDFSVARTKLFGNLSGINIYLIQKHLVYLLYLQHMLNVCS